MDNDMITIQLIIKMYTINIYTYKIYSLMISTNRLILKTYIENHFRMGSCFSVQQLKKKGYRIVYNTIFTYINIIILTQSINDCTWFDDDKARFQGVRHFILIINYHDLLPRRENRCNEIAYLMYFY